MLPLPTLATWLAVAIVLTVLGGLGRLVSGPQQATGPAFGPLWWGWGLGALALTLYVALTPFPLTPFLLGMGALGLLGYARHRPSRAELRTTALLLLLALPLLWAWSHAQVFMWDDFAHRLPSLAFVTTFDALPSHQLPPSFSDFPSYPYSLTVLGLAVSRLMGSYTELAIAFLNGALLVSLAGFIAQVLTGKTREPHFAVLAATLLGLILLNPVFQPKLVSSAYQDAALGWALAVSLGLSMPLLARPSRLPSWRPLLALGLTLALTTALKQVGLVLAVMFAIPLLGWLAWHHRTRVAVLALPAACLLGPTLLVWLAWRHYVATHIGAGEFSFNPLAQWHWNLLPAMLAGLGRIAVQKPFTLLPLLATTGFALTSWQPLSRFKSLREPLTLAALVGWGYLAFLFVAFLGSFSAYEAAHLASLSRYMQHANWMLWLALLLAFTRSGLPQRIAAHARTGRWLPWILPALCLAPFFLTKYLTGRTNPEALQMQRIATLLPRHIPAYKNLAIRVEDPTSSGFRGKTLQYYVGFGYRIHNGATTFGSLATLPHADAILHLGTPTEPATLQLCPTETCTDPVPLD